MRNEAINKLRREELAIAELKTSNPLKAYVYYVTPQAIPEGEMPAVDCSNQLNLEKAPNDSS